MKKIRGGGTVFQGSRLKRIRNKMGLNQKDFGKMIGVSKVTICGYENETRIPKMAHFLKMLDQYDVEPNYLLGRDIFAVSEAEEPYTKTISTDEIKILKAIERYPQLSRKLRTEPDRTVELIYRKLFK